MSKQPRFPRRIDTWLSESHADAVEAIADARVMTSSAVMREALLLYLTNIGALPPRPIRANGHPEHGEVTNG